MQWTYNVCTVYIYAQYMCCTYITCTTYVRCLHEIYNQRDKIFLGKLICARKIKLPVVLGTFQLIRPTAPTTARHWNLSWFHWMQFTSLYTQPSDPFRYSCQVFHLNGFCMLSSLPYVLYVRSYVTIRCKYVLILLCFCISILNPFNFYISITCAVIPRLRKLYFRKNLFRI